MTSFTISQQDAARELLRRRQARAGLIAFTEYTLPAYRTAAHHRLIADRLEAVARGEIDRLMINMPPRHGKSELASRRFPAWLLGNFPDQTVIAASYNMDKAQEFGGEVRDIVRSDAYAKLFPNVSLKEDTRAKGFWRTEAGGNYIAAGVGTAITGRGTPGPIALIDDPLKDRAEADSERQREAVKAWYSAVILSRFPRAIVVIQTRWHEDDLSGWLLSRQHEGGDTWEVLSLPAIDHQGQALWPEQYPIEVLTRLRDNSAPRDWSALYQQSPVPEGGLYFDRADIVFEEPPPKDDLRIIGASDYAVTEGSGDYTVHVVGGVDQRGRLHILDIDRRQSTADIWVEALCGMILTHKPIAWGEEEATILKSIGPFMQRTMKAKRAFVRRVPFRPVADKPTRARTLQALAGQGKLVLDPTKPWTPALLAELLSFPAGKHDDQVDALAVLAQLAEQVGPFRGRPRQTSYDTSYPTFD